MWVFFPPLPRHCESLMYSFCHLFSHSHFGLASIPSISLHPLPLFMLYLSHPLSVSGSSNSPCGAGVGQRGWEWRWGLGFGGEGWGGAMSGHRAEGAWPLVYLGAPNESVIHGTRGSHRDRIRGALSNRSPERVKRYLICSPRCSYHWALCVSLWVCMLFCECVRRLLAIGREYTPPHPHPKGKIQSCSKTDKL